MDTAPELLTEVFAAKAARRRVLSKAPFEEKIVKLIRLQEMAAVIAGSRGQMLRPWRTAANLLKPTASHPEI
jgi:hypothetical protein